MCFFIYLLINNGKEKCALKSIQTHYREIEFYFVKYVANVPTTFPHLNKKKKESSVTDTSLRRRLFCWVFTSRLELDFLLNSYFTTSEAAKKS